MTNQGIFPCYENQFQIKVNGEYVEVADMVSFSVAFDNGIETFYPYSEEGWVRALQTAKSIKFSVSGKRHLGDIANDYIASLAWLNGRDCEADVIWNIPGGVHVELLNSVFSVTNIGAGDSTNIAPLEFDLQSNGKPKVTVDDDEGED